MKCGLIDITGHRFGLYTVVKRAGRNASGTPLWLCRCDCGHEGLVQGGSLRIGRSKGCRTCRHGLRRHGMEGTREYRAWSAAKSRCTNSTHAMWPQYGGRGIRMCQRWMLFDNFIADMGNRPDGTSLDRINNDGNYEPGNCRWATRSQQQRNKRSNPMVEYEGRQITVTELAERTGVRYRLLRDRIASGWSVSESLGPSRKRASFGQ